MPSNIRTEYVTYTAGGKRLTSYLAWDASIAGPRPGIALFPEWWGSNEYIKRRARDIAALGYVGLACDVYGDGVEAADSTQAGALMNGLFADMNATSERVKAALDQLKARPEVDGARLGAMGYCLGGALSLHAARLGLDLRGVVSFHGSLGPTHAAKRGDVKAKVLVCHGADDVLVPPDQEAGFHKEMADLGVDVDFRAYPGAKHGFTNPEATAKGQKYGLPLAYDEKTDAQSWADMQAFWKKVFA
ncbi:MAG: dienelactone hydrolase family protein [Pseudomonadota bacterium]